VFRRKGIALLVMEDSKGLFIMSIVCCNIPFTCPREVNTHQRPKWRRYTCIVIYKLQHQFNSISMFIEMATILVKFLESKNKGGLIVCLTLFTWWNTNLLGWRVWSNFGFTADIEKWSIFMSIANYVQITQNPISFVACIPKGCLLHTT